MLEKNGLLPIIDDPNTTNPVTVVVTFDDGKNSCFFSHVTSGFKQVDHCCIDPKNGTALFSETGMENVQSHVHCSPINVCFAIDNKQLYHLEFGDFFAFLNLRKEEGSNLCSPRICLQFG
jgi:hypothetical protein